MPKKKRGNGWKIFGNIVWFIIKIPYYVVRGLAYFLEKVDAKTRRERVVRKAMQKNGRRGL